VASSLWEDSPFWAVRRKSQKEKVSTSPRVHVENQASRFRRKGLTDSGKEERKNFKKGGGGRRGDRIRVTTPRFRRATATPSRRVGAAFRRRELHRGDVMAKAITGAQGGEVKTRDNLRGKRMVAIRYSRGRTYEKEKPASHRL